MKHLLIVGAVCALLLLALLGVRKFDTGSAPRDEILAYEVSPEQGVEVTLHGGIGQISLTSWLLVPLDTPVEELLPYALELSLSDSNGKSRMSRRYENFTRVPERGDDSLAYAARVADAVGYVTEPRTVEVDVDVLASSAGRLRVRSSPGKYGRVLLRIAHKVKRSAFEKQLLARTMSTADREQLTAERTSLGFFDIPAAVRADALGYWHQRLTAAGREGRDYTVRRLLLGAEATRSAEPGSVGRGIASSPTERLAINLTGPVSLRVWSSQKTEIHVDLVGADTETVHPIGAERQIELALGEGGLGSVVLFADPPSQLSLSAPLVDAEHFITNEPLRQNGQRLEITPDVTYQPLYRLHASEPVVLSVAPGQARTGLSVRASASESKSRAEQTLRVVWQNAAGLELTRTTARLRFERSPFERVDEQPVSERRLAWLHVPRGADRLLVFGDPELLMSPFVEEPKLDEPRYHAPFDVVPPEGLRWMNAPFDVKDWALIRPDNEQILRRAGRTPRLRSQIRLETRVVEDPAIAPRTLEPSSEAQSRPVFTPSSYSPKLPFPEHAWVMLDPSRPERDVRVDASGELAILFLADSLSLGADWEVLANGQAVHRGSLAFRSGARRLDVSPGLVRLSTRGLGPGGLLLARAAPDGGGVVVRKQTFFALDRGGRLSFAFQRGSGELLTLVVMVATEGGGADVVLEHALDGGQDAGRSDVFYHRTTEYVGKHALRTGELGGALIWSEPFAPATRAALPDRLGRVVIALGDDLGVGRHRLTLRHPALEQRTGRNRYWVRAVVVGRVLGDE